MNFYVRETEASTFLGPLTLEEIQARIAAGTLAATCAVLPAEGQSYGALTRSSEWIPVVEVEGFQAPTKPESSAEISAETDLAPTCLRCGGAMVEGFVTDFAHGNVLVARWLEGKPVSGWFREVRPDKSVHQRKTRTYRCEQCGLLEWYA